jgi:hypothetical protein
MTGAGESAVLVLTDSAFVVRGRLEPVAWMVLEELALRAAVVDGLVVAEVGARSVGEALGRSKDSVARALRHLAAEGLVERIGERGEVSGRFAGVRYIVDLPAAGLALPGERVPVRVAVSPPAVDAHQVVDPSPTAPPVGQRSWRDHDDRRLF